MSRLPSVVLNDLRCASCRSYLSYRPVRILPNGSGICGRCENKTMGVVSDTYEALASIFSYPCNYRPNKCPRALPWAQVVLHEMRCSYKPGCCMCCRHPSSICGGPMKDPGDQGVSPIVADEKILAKLKCSSCNKYLSSAPIYIASDGSDICHRCGQNVHPELPRNVPLETILNAFVFECSYKNFGCHNLYSFSAISVHEADCNHRINYERYQYEAQRQHASQRMKGEYTKPQPHRAYENIPQAHMSHNDYINHPQNEDYGQDYRGSPSQNSNYRNVPVQSHGSSRNSHSNSMRREMNGQRGQYYDENLHKMRPSEAQKWAAGQQVIRELTGDNLRNDYNQQYHQASPRPSQMQRNNSQMRQEESFRQQQRPYEREMSAEDKYRQGMSGLIEELEAESREYSREISKDSMISSESPTDSRRSSKNQRSESGLKKEKKGKVRGLVATPRGPIYATISPGNNSIMAFKPQTKNDQQDDNFSDDGKRRGTSDTQSGGSTPNNVLQDAPSFRNPKSRTPVTRNESVQETGGYMDLVQELKFRQKYQGESKVSKERY